MTTTPEPLTPTQEAAIEACRLTGWHGVAERLERGWIPDADTNEGKLLALFARHSPAPAQGEGMVRRITHILEKWDVTEPPDAWTGQYWDEIAAGILSALAQPAAALREARESGYRDGYRHVLGLTRTGVPTADFERDVGAYMADFVGKRP